MTIQVYYESHAEQWIVARRIAPRLRHILFVDESLVEALLAADIEAQRRGLDVEEIDRKAAKV